MVHEVIGRKAYGFIGLLPVAESLALPMTLDKSYHFDTKRFPKSDGVHVSPELDTAENRVNIEFRVGAASLSTR